MAMDEGLLNVDIPRTGRLTRSLLLVAKLLLSGMSYKEIASKAVLTQKTIEAERARLYEQIGAVNHYQAIAILYKLGIQNVHDDTLKVLWAF